MQITICVLCFGDHTRLAKRCLDSIGDMLPTGSGHVKDIRIALNNVTDGTNEFVKQWVAEVRKAYDFPVFTYSTAENVCKYPLMRKMLYDEVVPEPGQWIMWFDDDSYFDEDVRKGRGASWWSNLEEQSKAYDMLGQFWLMPVQGNQLEWVKTQPWYNPQAGIPPKTARIRDPKTREVQIVPAFEFCQGAWWVIKFEVLKALNWPVPEIRHNGGDSMLGEALRHCGATMGRCYGGLRINADESGRHSKSKRRGRSENRVGWDYKPGKQYDLSHQDFDYTVGKVVTVVEPPPIVNLFDSKV